MIQLSIRIIEIEPRMGGAELVLTVSMQNAVYCEEKKLAVAKNMLYRMAHIGEGDLPYDLTGEQYCDLEYFEELWKAVKKGIHLLDFADATRLTIIKKLKDRGFDKHIAENAADYLVKYGYIDEKKYAEHLIDTLANTKLYGPSRIRAELYRKGISREIIDKHLDELLSQIDFEENLLKLVRKKCDIDAISDRACREKFYAAMYRLGYSVSQTRDAIKSIKEENEE